VRRIVILVFVMLVLASACAHGGSNAGHKIAIHVMSHESRTCSKSFPTITSCEDIVTTYADSGDIDVFPVFYELTEVTGMEYGLEWPTAWGTCAFTTCTGDFAIGGITNPGDGLSLTWTSCQEVSVVIVGFGWISATGGGMVRIVDSDATSGIGVVDCAFRADAPEDTVHAGIGGEEGDDPCDQPVPTDYSSWGKIKGMFR